MNLPNAVVTLIALVVGIATFSVVPWTWIRIRNQRPGGLDPSSTRAKIEASVILAAALSSSALAFFGVLVLLG